MACTDPRDGRPEDDPEMADDPSARHMMGDDPTPYHKMGDDETSGHHKMAASPKSAAHKRSVFAAL